MGKVTISTVLGYKEYVVENIKNIRGEDEENSDFRIYPDYHKIYRGQTEIVLTKAEYELFMLLSGRPGVIFTKEKIFEILYNEELPESIDNIVYCLVSSMRKKIEPELKQCRYIISLARSYSNAATPCDMLSCLFLLLFYAILRTAVVKVTSQKVCFLMGDVIGYFFISKKYIRRF